MKLTKTEERIRAARERLTGEAGPDELQAWFRSEVERRTDDSWEPGKATVYRHVKEARENDRLTAVLEEIEAEAAEADPPEPEPAPDADLPTIGRKRERNVLLLADWIRGASLGDLEESFGISKTRASQIIERAGVQRVEGAP